MSSVQIIRSLTVAGSVDKYWTGSKFSSDENEAMEVHSGRALSHEMEKASRFIAQDSQFVNKGYRATEIFSSIEAQDSYDTQKKNIDKRSTYTSNSPVDESILKYDSDGNGRIDPDKLKQLSVTRKGEKPNIKRAMPISNSGGNFNTKESTYLPKLSDNDQLTGFGK